ncbi:MAG: CvpA family protein [Pseudomonadota bacterium]
MVGSFSILDIVLVAVCLLSALLAMYRGFTREILSILSWLLAAGAVLYFVLFQKALADDVAGQIGLQPIIVQIILGALLFFIVLVVVHLVTSRLSEGVLDSRVGLFDRVFGFLFGVARGFILVMIPFLGYEKLNPPTAAQPAPAWISQSFSGGMLRSTGAGFEQFLIQNLDSATEQTRVFQRLPKHVVVSLPKETRISA